LCVQGSPTTLVNICGLPPKERRVTGTLPGWPRWWFPALDDDHDLGRHRHRVAERELDARFLEAGDRDCTRSLLIATGPGAGWLVMPNRSISRDSVPVSRCSWAWIDGGAPPWSRGDKPNPIVVLAMLGVAPPSWRPVVDSQVIPRLRAPAADAPDLGFALHVPELEVPQDSRRRDSRWPTRPADLGDGHRSTGAS